MTFIFIRGLTDRKRIVQSQRYKRVLILRFYFPSFSYAHTHGKETFLPKITMTGPMVEVSLKSHYVLPRYRVLILLAGDDDAINTYYQSTNHRDLYFY